MYIYDHTNKNVYTCIYNVHSFWHKNMAGFFNRTLQNKILRLTSLFPVYFYFVKWFIFIWQIFFAFYFAVNKSISTNAKVLTRKWNSCLELNLSLPEYFNWFPFRELWQKTLKLLTKIENIGLVWTYSPKTGLEHLLKNKHISKAWLYQKYKATLQQLNYWKSI